MPELDLGKVVGPVGPAGPEGAQGGIGPQGPAGQSATVEVGTTATGEPGSPASVSNGGTESAAVLNFTIPKGDPGPDGKSAYTSAVEAGYTGTEEAFSQALSQVPGHMADAENPHQVTAEQAGAVPLTARGAANGVASLDETGKVPSGQLPPIQTDGIPLDQKGAPGGVATLNEAGAVPHEQLPGIAQRKVEAILLAAGWTGTGPYTQTIEVEGVTASNYLTVQLGSSATAAEEAAAAKANIREFAQGDGTLTAIAKGARPGVDLPLDVLIMIGIPDGWEETVQAAADQAELNAETASVPVGRKVNGKPLSADVALTAADVGARPDSWMPTATEVGARPASWTPTAAEVGARSATWTPSAADVGAVPTGRTVNGKPLSSNIALAAGDVGARPSTWVPTAAEVGAVPTARKVNNKPLTADIALSAADVSAVPTTRTVNGRALSGNISLTAADVGALATSTRGAANGVAPLDSSGKLPVGNCPASLSEKPYVVGTYTGTNGGSESDPKSQTISLGFTPVAVFVEPYSYGNDVTGCNEGMAITGQDARRSNQSTIHIQSGGFVVYSNQYSMVNNKNNSPRKYIAFK